MKLSIETLATLKNFSKFQSGLIIPPGSALMVRAESVYAEATLLETFPSEIRVSDVQDFLRAVALFNDPEFEFTEEHIRIAESDGTAELVYLQAKPGSVAHLPVPKKMKPLPPENFTFTISAEQWATLQKALRKKDDWKKWNLTITSDGKAVRLVAERGLNSAAYSVMLKAPTNGLEFKCVLDSANLLMAEGPYQVTVTPTYTIFQHTGGYNLRYFVGSEIALSTWGEKKTYLVAATKSMVQDCQFSVLAHSAEEAEAIVRKKPDEDFRWTAEPRIRKDLKAVA